jgi:hypothetical protein
MSDAYQPLIGQRRAVSGRYGGVSSRGHEEGNEDGRTQDGLASQIIMCILWGIAVILVFVVTIVVGVALGLLFAWLYGGW